jgi:Mce-associated membrane protein
VTETHGGEPSDAPASEPGPEQHEADQPESERPAPERTGASTSGSRPLIVIAAALLVVATFLGVLAARYHAELTRDRDQRQAVEQVAARFATAFVTYDYRSLDASLTRIKRDATAKFAAEYERLFRTSLSTLIRETRAQSRGTVTDVFLGDVDDETASALIVVNVEREGAGGRLPVAGTYFQMDLVEQNGRWRVDNVTSINFSQSAGPTPGPTTPGAPAATTTTSAPE